MKKDLFLFAEDMIGQVENCKESTEKVPRICETSKVARYKVNIQKYSYIFTYQQKMWAPKLKL